MHSRYSKSGQCWDTGVNITLCRFFISFGSSPDQPAVTSLKLTIETLEQGVKYVQSEQ